MAADWPKRASYFVIKTREGYEMAERPMTWKDNQLMEALKSIRLDVFTSAPSSQLATRVIRLVDAAQSWAEMQDDATNKFYVGDVVRLKSGGPEMTIACTAGPDKYICHWFDLNQKFCQCEFYRDTIKVVIRSGK
jgi:uncharacterized protein YodC (DUF2158 family)